LGISKLYISKSAFSKQVISKNKISKLLVGHFSHMQVIPIPPRDVQLESELHNDYS
jgi:hypothetical protein